MEIVFWICWIFDILLLFFFLSTLLKSYTSGVMRNKSLNKIIEFLLLLAGVVWLVILAIILYKNEWLKTAAAFASIPVLTLLFIFLIPIIAYISGERMN